MISDEIKKKVNEKVGAIKGEHYDGLWSFDKEYYDGFKQGALWALESGLWRQLKEDQFEGWVKSEIERYFEWLDYDPPPAKIKLNWFGNSPEDMILARTIYRRFKKESQ